MRTKLKTLLSAILSASMLSSMAVVPAQGATSRYMEKLSRGLVAMQTDTGIYLSWRLNFTESYNSSFDVYRDGTKIATVSDSTNYLDASGSKSSRYYVVNTTTGDTSSSVTAFESGTNYIDIPLAPLDDFVAPDGTSHPYKAWEMSVGDLDGDGEYEYVIKRDANRQHVGSAGYNHRYIEAYELDGTVLWRIDMGINMRAMTEFVFLVYDFNNDGVAEMACKTAPGTKDGTGAYVTSVSQTSSIKNADNTADYRDDGGWVLRGPEYFTLFDGRNGAALDTIEYPILRGTDSNNTLNNIWGDNYGHRAEKCMGTVAYLDGVNPSMVLWRGIYSGQSKYGAGRTAAAAISVNSSDRLVVGNRFDTWSSGNGYESGNEKYIGQGNHNITVGDVDNDGKDEVLSGALCLDDDMDVLWCSYRGHGDAQHLGDYDPTNNTLEFFSVHEEGGTTNNGVTCDYGMTVYNASNGAEYKHVSNTGDTARGVMANLGVGSSYYQMWGIGAYLGYGGTSFSAADFDPAYYNFRIYWDADVYDELFDAIDSATNSTPIVIDYNSSTNAMETIFTAHYTTMMNSTKATPLLQADIFGDWREEFIVPHSDHQAVRIYSSNIVTGNKLYTLMSDSVYRLAVAWQNQYYVQPPHIGYYVTENSSYSGYDERTTQPNHTALGNTAGSASKTPTDVTEGALCRNTANEGYLVDDDGDYHLSHTAIVGGSSAGDPEGSDIWSFSGRSPYSALSAGSRFSGFLANCSGFEEKDGKFLSFVSGNASYAATFTATNTANAISDNGILRFDMSMPTTYASYGNSSTPQSRGNGTATITVGDSALVFTLTPTLTDNLVTSAVLNINGTDVHTYSSGADAMAWTSVNAELDVANSTATVKLTYPDSTTETLNVALNSSSAISSMSVQTASTWGVLLMDNLELAPLSSLGSFSRTLTPAASASVSKGGTAEQVLNLTSDDTNTLYIFNSSSASWHGAAVLQFTLPRRNPDSLTGASLYSYVYNNSGRNGDRTYYTYASDTNPTINSDLTDSVLFPNGTSIDSAYTADLVGTSTISLWTGAATTIDEDALLSAIKERMSIDTETTITFVYTGPNQELQLYMDSEHTPTLTLDFEEVNTHDVSFTTTPYAAVVVDGVEYSAGAAGTVTVPAMEEGRTLSYTIKKGGYDSYTGTVYVQNGASVNRTISLSDGYFFYEDFETVPTSDTSDKWGMNMPYTDPSATFTNDGKLYFYQAGNLRAGFKTFETITDAICGYKLSVDFAFGKPTGSSGAAMQHFLSFADKNGYVICGLAYSEASAYSGTYSLYAYADVPENTAGNSADIGVDSATLISSDITSGTLSAYIDYVNNQVDFYINNVYYTTINITQANNYTKTIDTMKAGVQKGGSLTVDNIIVTAYTPDNGANGKVFRNGSLAGYYWNVVETVADISTYDYWLNFSENGENIYLRDYLLDFGDSFSGDGDAAFNIFLNGSNAEEKLVLTKVAKDGSDDSGSSGDSTTSYNLSWAATAAVTAGETLMQGLTPVIDLSYTDGAKTFSDGKTFSGYISHESSNGKWSNGAATGTALKFVAPADGTFSVYTKVGSGKVAYIAEEGVSDVTSEYITSLAGTGDYEIVTAEVEAGKTYYAFVSGSKAWFYGASFTN